MAIAGNRTGWVELNCFFHISCVLNSGHVLCKQMSFQCKHEFLSYKPWISPALNTTGPLMLNTGFTMTPSNFQKLQENRCGGWVLRMEL